MGRSCECECNQIKYCNKYLLLLENLLFVLIAITHIILNFLVKQTDFSNIIDTLESSPLFEFSLNADCKMKSEIVFHTWEGRKDYYITRDFTIEDVTPLTKINGNKFCYKHISYEKLLKNGQIIKKGGNCPNEYTKNCGIIDTLEQELCIKDNEACPLYDAGIGYIYDSNNYIYNEGNSDVYYNKESYNKPNKKIIGKLILNHGQPCYLSDEKLWKKFSLDEAAEEHLKCDLEVLGKYKDDRYEKKGEISYRKLYMDNLNQKSKDLVLKNIGDQTVSLYKREFFGINKECNDKYEINKVIFDDLKSSQNSVRLMLLITGPIMIFIPILSIFSSISSLYSSSNYIENKSTILFIFLLIFMGSLFPCIICLIIFLSRMMRATDSYECSDSLTNSIIKLENKKTKVSTIITKIVLSLELFAFVLYLFTIIIGYIIKIVKESNTADNSKNKKDANDNNTPTNTDSKEIPLNTFESS